MSTWIKDNKSIAAVIGIGTAAFLGLTTYGIMQLCEKGDYKEAFESSKLRITNAAGKAQTPTDSVVKERTQALEAYQKQLDDTQFLYDNFRPTAEELKNVTPDAFRSTLTTTLNAFKKKAAERGVKVRNDFYMGFDQYATIPALQQATGTLQYQLGGINWLMERALENNLTEVVRVYRERFPLEKVEEPKADNLPRSSSRRNANVIAEKKEKLPYEKLRFGMALKGKRPIIINLLNDIMTSEKYLFTISGIKVVNEKTGAITIKAPTTSAPKSSAKGGQLDLSAQFGATTTTRRQAASTPGTPVATKVVSPVTGDDQVEFYLLIDMILLPAKENGSDESATPSADAEEGNTNA